MKEENKAIKEELNRITREYEKLISDNTSLKVIWIILSRFLSLCSYKLLIIQEQYDTRRGNDDSGVEKTEQHSGAVNHEKHNEFDVTEGNTDTFQNDS